jgi:CheY-like chemotaxis protein
VGTTVRIALPCVAMPAADAAAPKAPESRGHERVLLMEDETGVRKVTARLLRARGYEVIEARDAEDAIRTLAEAKAGIDLLLTDVVLPGMSGRELAERVHKTRAPMLDRCSAAASPDFRARRTDVLTS